jgi:hypothetical protein
LPHPQKNKEEKKKKQVPAFIGKKERPGGGCWKQQERRELEVSSGSK